LLIIYN